MDNIEKDIWMVVFDNEYELLLLEQAIYAYDRLGEKTPINIIINEFDNQICCKIQEHILSFENNLDLRIYFPTDLLYKDELERIFKRIELAKEVHYQGIGWVVQQYLKLAVYRKSTAVYSYILDCKNIPVKKNAIELLGDAHTFEDFDGTFIYDDYKMLLIEKGLIKSLQIPQRSVLTPFIFKNSVLRDMHKEIDVFGLIFLNINSSKDLISLPLVSETILYNCYENFKRKYVFEEEFSQKARNWNISENIPNKPWHSSMVTFKDWLEHMREKYSFDYCYLKYDKICFITIHRRILEADETEIKNIRTILNNFISMCIDEYNVL